MEVADLNMRAPYFYPTASMSYEGGVMPSDMMQDIMPKAGNTWFWAKVLSAHGGGGAIPSQGTVPG